MLLIGVSVDIGSSYAINQIRALHLLWTAWWHYRDCSFNLEGILRRYQRWKAVISTLSGMGATSPQRERAEAVGSDAEMSGGAAANVDHAMLASFITNTAAAFAKLCDASSPVQQYPLLRTDIWGVFVRLLFLWPHKRIEPADGRRVALLCYLAVAVQGLLQCRELISLTAGTTENPIVILDSVRSFVSACLNGSFSEATAQVQQTTAAHDVEELVSTRLRHLVQPFLRRAALLYYTVFVHEEGKTPQQGPYDACATLALPTVTELLSSRYSSLLTVVAQWLDHLRCEMRVLRASDIC